MARKTRVRKQEVGVVDTAVDAPDRPVRTPGSKRTVAVPTGRVGRLAQVARLGVPA